MIIWSARPKRGPKAPLGSYKVRVKTGKDQATKAFKVQMNPNLKGITKEDLDEQFQLANNIMQKTSAANEAVIHIRKIKAHLHAYEAKLSKSRAKKTVTAFVSKLSTIEEALYQVSNQSNQDPLNFLINLNNRLDSLRRCVDNGYAKPTDGAY